MNEVKIIIDKPHLPTNCDSCDYSYITGDYYGDLCTQCALLDKTVLEHGEACPLKTKAGLIEQLENSKLEILNPNNDWVYRFNEAVDNCIDIVTNY